MTKPATIKSEGSRFYISHGITRSRHTYSTPGRAKAAAEKQGYTVDTETMPSADAVSVSHLVKLVDNHAGFFFEFTFPDAYVKITAESSEELNKVLRKLNFKPIALRHNQHSNRAFIEDADTPNYCSPASEAYWSM